MPENWKFLTEAHKFTDLPQDEIPEIVFWGRSNAVSYTHLRAHETQ